MNKNITKISSILYLRTTIIVEGRKVVSRSEYGRRVSLMLITIVLNFRVCNAKHIDSEGKLESLT